VVLEDWEADSWEVSEDVLGGGPSLEDGDTFNGLLKGIMGSECLRVAQLVLWVLGGHKFTLFGGNASCHWVSDVDSDDKPK